MFSDILRSLRNQKNISQPQLAREIGISSGNISDWETGRSKPGYVALSALSRFFEVSADFLLELNAEPVKAGEGLELYKIEQGLTCDKIPLDDEEADLVAMYRMLPPSHQEELYDLAYFKYQRFVEQKKGSIYSTYADDKKGPGGSRETPSGTA